MNHYQDNLAYWMSDEYSGVRMKYVAKAHRAFDRSIFSKCENWVFLGVLFTVLSGCNDSFVKAGFFTAKQSGVGSAQDSGVTVSAPESSSPTGISGPSQPPGSTAPNPTASSAPLPVPVPSPSAVVCNPLGSTTASTSTNGLQGSLFYLEPGSAQYANTNLKVMDYKVYGKNSGVALYVNDLNVPARSFDQGFPASSGKMVTDAN
ncbi:MAG: hypothetical protein AABZ55_14525, partial [Bdellovibrionota bacterium]